MKGIINIDTFIGNCNEQGIGIRLVDIVAAVKSFPGADEFDVYINSPGGEVSEGFAIHDYLATLAESGIKINTIGRNEVASIATVVFMAGENRYLEPGTVFMIHLPSGQPQRGSAAQIAAYAASMVKLEKEMVDFYASKISIDKDSIFALLDSETWLTADDCINLGISQPLQTQTLVVARAISSNKKTFLSNYEK